MGKPQQMKQWRHAFRRPGLKFLHSLHTCRSSGAVTEMSSTIGTSLSTHIETQFCQKQKEEQEKLALCWLYGFVPAGTDKSKRLAEQKGSQLGMLAGLPVGLGKADKFSANQFLELLQLWGGKSPQRPWNFNASYNHGYMGMSCVELCIVDCQRWMWHVPTCMWARTPITQQCHHCFLQNPSLLVRLL